MYICIWVSVCVPACVCVCVYDDLELLTYYLNSSFGCPLMCSPFSVTLLSAYSSSLTFTSKFRIKTSECSCSAYITTFRSSLGTTFACSSHNNWCVCLFPAYITVVEKEVVAFETEARQLTRIGDVQKAETMMNKCKLAKKEVSCLLLLMLSVCVCVCGHTLVLFLFSKCYNILHVVCFCGLPCLDSPWYNRTGWLGIKHQRTYLLTLFGEFLICF